MALRRKSVNDIERQLGRIQQLNRQRLGTTSHIGANKLARAYANSMVGRGFSGFESDKNRKVGTGRFALANG